MIPLLAEMVRPVQHILITYRFKKSRVILHTTDWIPPIPGHLLQVAGKSSCSRGQQLAGSGAQPPARQA